MLYVVSSATALQGLVFPSMNSTLSRLVAGNEQGELQGGVASMQSASAILGPLVMTGVFAHFTRPGSVPRIAGAAFLLSALLTLGALGIVVILARGAFARPAAATDPR